MSQPFLRRIVESGVFEWPWSASHGLLIIRGASGGGGGGGGAMCLDGLNLYGSDGGKGGEGGIRTVVNRGERKWIAAGGEGGSGGGGGGIRDGEPDVGIDGRGSRHGDGGKGGEGAKLTPAEGRLVASGGNGGSGFPGETLVVELNDLSHGVSFKLEIGVGGDGGLGGQGFTTGTAGGRGANGYVLFAPLVAEQVESS